MVLTSFGDHKFYRTASQEIVKLRGLLGKVDPSFAARLAVYARDVYGMRTISHILAVELLPYISGEYSGVSAFYDRMVVRPDDMTEMLAYWMQKNKIKQHQKRKKLPYAMKRGFASALSRMDAYRLLLRNINNIMEQTDLVDLLCEKLVDAEAIRRSRILPFRFAVAYRNVQKHGNKIRKAVAEAAIRGLCTMIAGLTRRRPIRSVQE